MRIRPNDLKPLHNLLSDEIAQAVQRVLASGYFILGPEVDALEQAFATYHEATTAVAVANGTDAIELALRAYDIGAGDEVITVAHTALPTVVAIERAGATPILVDIEPDTYTMDAAAARAAITHRTKAIVPVHLYGQPANIIALRDLAAAYNLLLLEDCAQAHGARSNGQLVGNFGQIAAFSFYPTKNMAAYGDAGMILVHDAQIAARLRRLRNYGQESRYHHVEWGINSRMDDLQAAILRVKLAHLDAHNKIRRSIAARYDAGLSTVQRPVVRDGAHHVYHLYVVRHQQRDVLQTALAEKGVQTLIHYPVPIHLQKSHAHLGLSEGALPFTEHAAREILSLPLYVGLPDHHIDAVIQHIQAFAG